LGSDGIIRGTAAKVGKLSRSQMNRHFTRREFTIASGLSVLALIVSDKTRGQTPQPRLARAAFPHCATEADNILLEELQKSVLQSRRPDQIWLCQHANGRHFRKSTYHGTSHYHERGRKPTMPEFASGFTPPKPIRAAKTVAADLRAQGDPDQLDPEGFPYMSQLDRIEARLLPIEDRLSRIEAALLSHLNPVQGEN
jgi:hypothetical protein